MQQALETPMETQGLQLMNINALPTNLKISVDWDGI